MLRPGRAFLVELGLPSIIAERLALGTVRAQFCPQCGFPMRPGPLQFTCADSEVKIEN